MNKIFLLHPEPMPCIRNRAVFQRPLWFATHFDLSILSMHGLDICDEIAGKSKIVRLSFWKGRIGKLIWKVATSLWLIGYAAFHPMRHREVIVYAFPQWGWLPLVVAKVVGYKVMVDMQHTPLYYTEYVYINRPGLLAGMYYRALGWSMTFTAKLLLRHLDLVISMSHADDTGFSKLFMDKFHVPADKLLSIPNGIETNSMSVANLKSANGKTRIVYAGNIQFSKIDSILATIYSFVERGVDLEFHIAGKVSRGYRDKFDLALNKYGKFVKYHGHMDHDQLIELYKQCDFGLFMVDKRVFDHNHSHPGKIFEYMLYGCLPIASKIESLRFVIQNGVNGVLFTSEKDLEMALGQLIAEPDRCNRMRLAAFDAAKMFDWQKLNLQLVERMQAASS